VLGWTIRQADQVRESHAQEEAVGDLGAGSSAVAPIDGELVAEGEDLELQGDLGAKAGAKRGGRRDEDRHQENRRLPRLGGGLNGS
jgi:hypothetical protein